MAKEKILDIIKSSKTIDSNYDIKINKGQGTNAASVTRKDYVDGQDALKVNKAGDTMTGSLTTTANLYADGEIRSKNSLISTDSANTYTTRIAVVGSIGYFQSGKTDRDVADQKMILTGWQGTPLSMSKFTMANGVNPQVQWGSTNYDILHRGNMPTVTDLNAVSKSGDTIAHLTINPNGYFKQNYHIDAGYKFSKLIGSITDTKAGLIVLGENLSTNQQPEGFSGTISIQRGGIGSANITNVINLVVKKAYNSIEARIISTTPPRSGGRLCKITHEGKDYIAYYSSPASNRNVVVDGISWGIEPFVIPDATGYVLSDLISSTDTIRTDTNDYMLNNNNNERVPSWGLGEGQGFVMHGKTAIGGANDGWLRLNPFDAFVTGIYTGNGIIRHGGTSIQLGSLGDAQATTLYRPNDAAWGLTTGGYAAVSVKQNTSSAAHWLLGSYKGSVDGDMRAGIQVLSNDAAHMRLYTNMRTHYAEIRDGNILVSGAQSAAGNSLTRKDYVDSQDALKLNKAGDTMTGNLTVNANINAYSILSTGSITANTTSTFSGLRLSSNAIGYSEIVPRRANEADYLWSNGIRYYDSNNYWAIGSNRILHDAYSPRLTSIVRSTDLNTISVPINTMSLAHFGTTAANKPNTSNSANSVIHISNLDTGVYAHQLAFSSDGKMYNRYNDNVSWSSWGQVYTSLYKPNPADVGAVNKTGDTMTGVLNVPRIKITAADAGLNNPSDKNIIRFGGSGNDTVIGNPDGATYIDIKGVSVYVREDGLSTKQHKVYHEGFKPTAADVGALPASGNTVASIIDNTTNIGKTVLNYQTITTWAHPVGTSLFVTALSANKPGGEGGYWNTVGRRDSNGGYAGIFVEYANSKNGVWIGKNETGTSAPIWQRVYTDNYKPTAVDVGAVAKSGDSMIGQLILTPSFVDTSVNAQLAHIGKDATKPLYIRNMREHSSSTWLWEKVYNGALYYSSGIDGSGPNRVRLQVSGSGEIYLGTNADKRVYHEGFKPTAADVGAVNKTGDTMTGRVSIEGRNSPGAFGVKRINSTQFANYGQSGDTGGEAIVGVGPSTEHFDSYLKVGVNKLTFQGGSGEKKVYHEGFKPTASDVGATPSGYGVGEAAALKPDANALPNVGGIFAAAGAGSLNYANQYSTIIQAFRPGVADASGQVLQIQELDGSIAVRNRNGGYWTSWNKLYGERNRPTPGDVGAVNKTGDTMTGNLTVPAVLVSSAQNTSVNALTRKDYVDAEVAKLLARIVALESK